MKWPSGPLEIGRRARAQTLTAEVKELLLAWQTPAALEILRGSPVDCLIINWAAGAPEDQEQQRTLTALIEAGRALGISFVGAVSGKQGQQAALAAGRQAGLSAALVEEAPAQPCPLPLILGCPRSQIPWDSTFPLLSISGNRWPGVGLKTMRGDEAIAGPTGIPWMDSNGWLSLLANQLGKGKQCWLDVDPPDSGSRHAANYPLAVADSQAYGSRWIISLDDRQRSALFRKDLQAMSLWGGIASTLSFFQKHKEWRSYQPQGVLALISDFRGKNQDFADEVLNLLSRRGVQWQVIARPRPCPAHLGHLKVIAWLDDEMPGAELQSRLLAFARQGGSLIVPPSWKFSEGQPTEGALSERYAWRRVGSGRAAQSREEFQDPYQVAVDIHLLTSRRNDLARLFNADTANCFCSAPPGGRKSLVQVLDYSSAGPADFVSLWVRRANRKARLWNIATQDPVAIGGRQASDGVEFELPSFSVYAALEFDVWGWQ
jgi:hypothetical protein